MVCDSESKSQPPSVSNIIILGCLSDQRYNFLKANHNALSLNNSVSHVVYQLIDTIFCRQITTGAVPAPVLQG